MNKESGCFGAVETKINNFSKILDFDTAECYNKVKKEQVFRAG